MWHQEFRELMVELADLFHFGTYVEIGAKDGDTFNLIAPMVKKAVAVDLLPMSRIKKRPNVQIFQMSSVDFAAMWKEPIDFLFIDADHSCSSLLTDLKLLSGFVTDETGIVLLHDTYPVMEEYLKRDKCGDAWKVAWMVRHREVDELKDFEIVTLPGPKAGLSILRKAKVPLYWKK